MYTIKQTPFYATVKGDALECYNWKDGDKLLVVDLIEELDANINEYLWKAINLSKDVSGLVATSQICVKK